MVIETEKQIPRSHPDAPKSAHWGKRSLVMTTVRMVVNRSAFAAEA
jgi:hypothetical protein